MAEHSIVHASFTNEGTFRDGVTPRFEATSG